MPSTPKFCVHCGAPLTPGSKFCMKCGNQLVRNLYDTTEIKPTEIKQTEVKPTEIEPTEIKPAEIKPTEIEPTEIKPTEITPAEIEPTNIEPTPIKPGVFNNKFFMFFTNPNPLPFGIATLVSSITTTILIGVNGFKWWIVFFLLITLGSIFEVVWSFIKTPATNQAGNKSFGNKFKNWLGIKQDKSKMVKTIIGTASGMTGTVVLSFFLLISLFMGFKNWIVLDGHSFKYAYTSYGYNPETDYEIVDFYAGYKARVTYYIHGEVKFQASGSYWRIGSDCGLKCKTLEQGTWEYIGGGEEWGETTNFIIKNATTLLSGGCYFYRM